MTDITALAFMNDKVDKSIKLVDLEILRCDMNSQIILGPGPDKGVVLKAIETLDFHTTQKYFFQDRKLYAKAYKPLSPEKQLQPQPENQSNQLWLT